MTPLSVKQLADEFNTSKVSIYETIKNNNIKPSHRQIATSFYFLEDLIPILEHKYPIKIEPSQNIIYVTRETEIRESKSNFYTETQINQLIKEYE